MASQWEPHWRPYPCEAGVKNIFTGRVPEKQVMLDPEFLESEIASNPNPSFARIYLMGISMTSNVLK